MKKYISLAAIVLTTCFTIASSFADDKKFTSEKILTDLEIALQLESEQISQLKPTIEAKSEELKKSIHETVDKGFVELDELTAKLTEMSKNAENKVEAFLNSQEMQKLKDYLSKIDKEAIEEVKQLLVAELTEVLALTEVQLQNLKPVLEESMDKLVEITAELAKKGSDSWAEFKHQYEQLSREMKEKIKDHLNGEQMNKLKKYNEEKQEKIHQVLFNA